MRVSPIWLGFENNYDINGDDIQGFDLNKKVARFEIVPPGPAIG